MHEYIVKQGGQNHPNANIEFKLGDVVTTVIKTINGENKNYEIKNINGDFIDHDFLFCVI